MDQTTNTVATDSDDSTQTVTDSDASSSGTLTLTADAGLPSPAQIVTKLQQIRDRLANHQKHNPGGHHATVADQTIKDLDGVIASLSPPQQPAQG
jgi:hypothetical protein